MTEAVEEIVEFGRFFLPGPTEVRPEVMRAMIGPMIGHRTDEMVALMGGIQPRLRPLFGTERPVYVAPSSGTGMMEAAVANLCARRVLCLVCGAFSDRFFRIAAGLGVPADRLEVEWGRPNRPERLREKLRESPGRYDLVTVVHSETSTGVLNPVGDLAEVVRDFEDVLLAVDGVSSVAGCPMLVDEWGLDYALTGSQKALALPPGLAFAVAGERALDRARRVPDRGYYFDLLTFEKQIAESQTPTTPAVSMLYALDFQLRRIEVEGVEERWRRHWEMARRTHEWAEALTSETGEDFSVLAPPGFRSPTVTALRLPGRLAGPEVARRLQERGYTVSPGYGKLKERTIRIGHMGDHTLEELEALLGELGRLFRE